jgi:uncharacterized protein
MRPSGWIPAPRSEGVALVTGASSGIGAELARGLAARGHDVVIVARRIERLARLARELEATGVTAQVVSCDLTEEEERGALAAAVAAMGVDVDILCNNAGSGRPGHFASADRQQQLDMLRLNVEALVDLCGRFLQPMVDRGRGAILNVGSISGFAPLPAMAVYAASKAAILSFTEALHTEVRPSGVAVTALCPGFVRTEFIGAAGLTAAAAATPAWVFQDPRDVAAAGLRALHRNRRVVVPSLLYRAVAAGLRMTPDGALATVFDAWSPFRRGGAIAEAGAVRR